MTTVEAKFAETWASEVEDRKRRSPNFKVEDYTATGRAAAAYGGKRTEQWWLDNGPAMVQDWIDWRKQTGWSLIEINGKPSVEVDLLFELPGVDLPIKAYIDRVFALPTGEFGIVDLKTGRTPETPEQLGLYRVGLGLVHNIWCDWGWFWSPGGKGHGQPIDLRPWTPERFSILFNQAIAGINAGAWLPNAQNNCKSWCGTARYCAATGGAEAAGHDSLAV